MESIQALISEHISVLLQYYFEQHFTGLPDYENELTLNLNQSHTTPQLQKVSDTLSRQLVGPFIATLHAVHNQLKPKDDYTHNEGHAAHDSSGHSYTVGSSTTGMEAHSESS